MPRSAGTINAEVTVDPSKAKKGTKEAKNALQSFIRGLKSLAGVVSITLAVNFAVSKFRQFINFAIEVSSQFEIQKAALAAIIQGQERFLDISGRQIPVELARTQALQKTQQILTQINDAGLRPALQTAKEFGGSFIALLPTLRAFGVELNDAAPLMKKIADAATLASIPLDEMVNQSRQILSSNISNETKLAKIVGLNNQIVNQAKQQGTLTELLDRRFGSIANNIDLVQNTLKAAQVELRNTVELQIDRNFVEARDAVKDLLIVLNEVAKSDAFANLVSGAATFVATLAEGAGLLAKIFERQGVLVNPLNFSEAVTQARIDIVVDKASAKLKQLASVSKEAFGAAFDDVAKQLVDTERKISDITELLGGQENVETYTSTFSKIGLAIGDAFGGDKAEKVRVLTDELGKLQVQQRALSDTLERGRVLRPLTSKQVTPEESIQVQINTAKLKGNTQEVERLSVILDKTTDSATKLAEVKPFSPELIAFALTDLIKIDDALQRQEKFQANIRSLELQRQGINADLAGTIAEQETLANTFLARQRAVVQAETTLNQQADNFVSKQDEAVLAIDRIHKLIFDAAGEDAKRLVTVNAEIAILKTKDGLLENEQKIILENLVLEKKSLEQKHGIGELRDELLSKAKEEFDAAEGTAKLETEIGKAISAQSSAFTPLIINVEEISRTEEVRLKTLKAQNVELAKQVQNKKLDLAQQKAQLQADFENKQLELKQRIEREGFVGFGAEQDRFELGQEQQQLDLEIVNLEEQKAIAAQQTAEAGKEVVAIQGQINQLGAEATPEQREQLNLHLQDAQAQQGIVDLQQERLDNEIAIAQATRDALPKIFRERQAAKFGQAVGQDFRDALEGSIQSAIDGDFDFRKFGKQLSAALLKTAIQPFLDTIATSLGQLFKQLAAQFGSALSSAVLSVVGILGVLAFSKSESQGSPTNAGLGRVFEETGEPLRGVIAGRKSIPVAQIHSALAAALIPTNQILRQIAANTARLNTRGSTNGQQSIDVNTAALNATATV